VNFFTPNSSSDKVTEVVEVSSGEDNNHNRPQGPITKGICHNNPSETRITENFHNNYWDYAITNYNETDLKVQIYEGQDDIDDNRAELEMMMQ
jgi:hypothetical protein